MVWTFLIDCSHNSMLRLSFVEYPCVKVLSQSGSIIACFCGTCRGSGDHRQRM